MGFLWNDPKWKQQGRTGPGPAAPRYARRADRNAVRRGRSVPAKGSGSSSKSIAALAIGLLVVPIAAILSAAGYLAHGHGWL